jgi:hypothetical protein
MSRIAENHPWGWQYNGIKKMEQAYKFPKGKNKEWK